jgi:pimeloyl-ACP methyl ester carboxylesterase
MPQHYRIPLLTLTLLASLLFLAGCGAVDGQTVRNVLEYQVRKTLPPVLVYREPLAPASLAGVVRDEAGQPIANAVVLVSNVYGEAVHTRSDGEGRYSLGGITPGRTTPMAGAWGFVAVNGPALRLSPGQQLGGLDFTLPTRRPQPVEPGDLEIGQPVQESSQFPQPMTATRIPFSFTLDGVRIDNGQIYLPAHDKVDGSDRSTQVPDSSSSSPSSPPPTLVIIYPSHPLNWNAASVALTRDGNPVLALGPHSSGGLDIEQHARHYRAALQLWQSGQLAPLGQPDERWVAMSGSFSSLIMFKALQDLPAMPPAIVDVGGISDAFLGIQALYDADLAIPPPYDSAVAALGRPDRDPAFFYGFSPIFYADKLPPTLVIHTTNDEVIPHNQAEALAAALAAAGVPHELLLYEDTTHYLDAYNPTAATHRVYERVLAYVRTMGQAADQ